MAERIHNPNYHNPTRLVPTTATRLSGFYVSDTEFIRWACCTAQSSHRLKSAAEMVETC